MTGAGAFKRPKEMRDPTVMRDGVSTTACGLREWIRQRIACARLVTPSCQSPYALRAMHLTRPSSTTCSLARAWQRGGMIARHIAE